MQGIGWLKDKLPGMKQVRGFYMTDTWDVACDPLHTLWCAVDPVHGGNPAAASQGGNRHQGVGPGVAFGQELYRLTGVPQGLLACAHGGTSMKQWDPSLKKAGGRSLYGAMCRRVTKNGGTVAGVFWYQGCSETQTDAAVLYTPRMKRLVQSMRKDFKNPRMPIVVVQIARKDQPEPNDGWDSIREQQRRLPDRIKRLAVVPAIDLPLDDGIHISGSGQHVLGRRAAEAMRVLCEGKNAGTPPIEVDRIDVRPNPISNCADVIVRFKHVVGSLTSKGLPYGFSLDDVFCRSPYRTDLDGNKAILHLGYPVENIAGAVYYGRGLSPYCNITDQADRSIPAFGPISTQIAEPRAITDFINKLRISPVLPGVNIRTLDYPQSIALQPRQFQTVFCDRHLELASAGEALVYYALDFRCSMRMKLSLLLGYDGPVKVWINRKPIYCDPAGTNPAHIEDAAIPFIATPGQHEVLVALGSHGAAWGVYLRLERTDVSKATLRKRPESIAKPEILF